MHNVHCTRIVHLQSHQRNTNFLNVFVIDLCKNRRDFCQGLFRGSFYNQLTARERIHFSEEEEAPTKLSFTKKSQKEVEIHINIMLSIMMMIHWGDATMTMMISLSDQLHGVSPPSRNDLEWSKSYWHYTVIHFSLGCCKMRMSSR